MIKKLSIGIVISGFLFMGYCALSTIWTNTATSNEDERDIEKKDNKLSNSHRERSTSFIY